MIGLVSAGEIITLLRMLCLQGRICFAVCLHSLTTDASTCASVLADSVVNYGALRAVFALVCASLYWTMRLPRVTFTFAGCLLACHDSLDNCPAFKLY